MKTFIQVFALSLLLSTSAYSEDSNVEWVTNIEEAKTASEDTGKPILMCFSGSDWCKPCIILKSTVLESETFASYAEGELIMLKVDFPRLKKNHLSEEQLKHNEALAEKYNKEGSFPLMVIINQNEEIVTKLKYWNKSPDELITYIKNLN